MKRWVLALLVWFGAFTPLLAQDAYVDAPPVFAADPNQVGGAGGVVGGGQAVFTKDGYNQLSTGMINYGYADHVYAQYTGDSDYAGGNAPTSLFTNINYLKVHRLDLPYPFLEFARGWAWGLEFINFTSTPETVLLKPAAVPTVEMTANVMTANGRLYFRDLHTDNLQPFVGMGLGVISGEFAGSTQNGDATRSTFSGLVHFRTFGANLVLAPQWGLILEMRSVTSPSVKVSNDPYQQSNGSLYLNFSGTMLNMVGYYRF